MKGKVFQSKKDIIEDLISSDDVVLDVGFWGQGTKIEDEEWPHKFLLSQSKEVFGLDVEFDEDKLAKSIDNDLGHYKKVNADSFDFEDKKFDVIFASDLIEHLSNPGLFFDCCKENLKKDGKLIIGTPNCFNLFNLASKITKKEPPVNSDHTCYFSEKTFRQLCNKNGFEVTEVNYLYHLPIHYKQSLKKRVLNFIYWIASKFTRKYMQNYVFVVKRK